MIINFLKKQFIDIYNSPRKIVSKSLLAFQHILRLMFLPINIFLFLIIIIISPFILIRFGKIKSSWIGEFVMRTEVYLLEKKINNVNSVDLFFLDSFVSNKFLQKKISKKIIIVPRIFRDVFSINIFSCPWLK